MKKVLFIAAALAIGTTGFAQKGMERIKAVKPQTATADIHKPASGKHYEAPINFAPNAGVPANYRGDDYIGWPTMSTLYDLQSNGFVANRMWRFDDGSVGVVATWSKTTNFADRGTGYNYYDGTAFQWDEFDGEPMPGRVENERTGWPSYCQYGPEGEIVIAHTGDDLVYYTREKKGEGAWQGPKHIPNPNLGLPTEILTWPRVVTSGPNHDIIHVLCADQESETYVSYDFYARSTNGEDWVVSTVPTLPDAHFSSDYYALASNGNTVAMLFVGDAADDAYLIKSTDNGETWEQTIIWDNPYSEFDWETDPNSLWGCEECDEYLYGPETGAITIDNNGMVHCAFSTKQYYHDELGTGYTFTHGPTVDGIFYWNETMGTMVAPEWTCPDDGTVIPSNPMNCFRMWWPTGDGTGYITRNLEANNNIVGFITPTEGFNEVTAEQVYYNDYYSYFQGSSALPAICVDENGTVAVAFSSQDLEREMFNNNQFFYRSVYVSFIEPGYAFGDATGGDWSDVPGNVYYNYVKLQDADDFAHSQDEAIGVCGIANTTNHEFWFSYQADNTPGLGVGNSATQGGLTDNIIWAQKVVPDYPDLGIETPAVNPMTNTRIYPNPVVDQMTIEVNASQASEMSISVYNLMGQKVMDKNVSINTGINTPTLNTSSLSSGVYFVTVKANGFENTMKFVVK